MAEVEARLHLVRRRINAFTLQHVAYLGLSVLAVVAAGLVICGLRASAETFRAAAWSSLGVVLAVAAFGAFVLAARWVDLGQAATLTDRRTGLSDRLTTLMALRARPQESRLLPLLVTQALDLRARWRPESVAPRGVPRSAFVFLASLALLASTAFLERSNIEAAAAKTTAADDLDVRLQRGGEPPRPQPRSHTAGQVPGSGPESPSAQAGDDAALAAAGIDGEGTYDGTAPIQASAELGALPDRLQDAIRRAFRAEPMKDMRQLGGLPDLPAQGRGRGPHAREEPGPDSDGAGLAAKGDREARGEAQRPPAEQPGLDRDQHGEPRQQAGQRRDDAGQSGERAGSSAGAGDEAGTRPPLGAEADLGQDGGQPSTFKLTLSSFLAAVDHRGVPQRDGRSAPSGGGGGPSGRGLSDQQLKDDVLRKAEIPPEYEDVVRRAYSEGK